MIDLATKLRFAVLLKVYPELSADEVIRALSMAWLAQYPKPKMIVADNAKSFISNRFHEFMMELNILLHFPLEKEPWSHGIVEAAIQDVKHVATAIQTESMENKPEVTLALTTSALNSTEYTAGFSSHQWAFGAKLSISDEGVRLWRAVDPALDFVNVSQARLAAEEIARRSRARRVLSKLTNTTVKQPLRSYKPTELVMVWRQVQVGEQHQGPRGGHKKSGRPHWAVPHQGEEDDRQHILWILVGRKLSRCSVHSVRPVTESERLHYELTSGEDPSSWKTLQDVLPRREYVDITSKVPGPEDRELPDLPPEPDGATYAPIRRAIGKSTLWPEDYKKVHRSSPIGQEEQKPPRPPKYLPDPVPLPEGAHSSSSRTPPPKVSDEEYYPTSAEEEGPVNEYEDKKQTAPPLDNTADEPDYKKVCFEGDKKATSAVDEPDYKKLKLELLHEEAEREITHNDIFNVLEDYVSRLRSEWTSTHTRRSGTSSTTPYSSSPRSSTAPR